VVGTGNDIDDVMTTKDGEVFQHLQWQKAVTALSSYTVTSYSRLEDFKKEKRPTSIKNLATSGWKCLIHQQKQIITDVALRLVRLRQKMEVTLMTFLRGQKAFKQISIYYNHGCMKGKKQTFLCSL
jgi:hypothetical protein